MAILVRSSGSHSLNSRCLISNLTIILKLHQQTHNMMHDSQIHRKSKSAELRTWCTSRVNFLSFFATMLEEISPPFDPVENGYTITSTFVLYLLFLLISVIGCNRIGLKLMWRYLWTEHIWQQWSNHKETVTAGHPAGTTITRKWKPKASTNQSWSRFLTLEKSMDCAGEEVLQYNEAVMYILLMPEKKSNWKSSLANFWQKQKSPPPSKVKILLKFQVFSQVFSVVCSQDHTDELTNPQSILMRFYLYTTCTCIHTRPWCSFWHFSNSPHSLCRNKKLLLSDHVHTLEKDTRAIHHLPASQVVCYMQSQTFS